MHSKYHIKRSYQEILLNKLDVDKEIGGVYKYNVYHKEH